MEDGPNKGCLFLLVDSAQAMLRKPANAFSVFSNKWSMEELPENTSEKLLNSQKVTFEKKRDMWKGEDLFLLQRWLTAGYGSDCIWEWTGLLSLTFWSLWPVHGGGTCLLQRKN